MEPTRRRTDGERTWRRIAVVLACAVVVLVVWVRVQEQRHEEMIGALLASQRDEALRLERARADEARRARARMDALADGGPDPEWRGDFAPFYGGQPPDPASPLAPPKDPTVPNADPLGRDRMPTRW